MMDREYYRNYYKKHRDTIREQTRERVKQWRQKHHEEYLSQRRKTLAYYLSQLNPSNPLNPDEYPSPRKEYLKTPFREIVKGDSERKFIQNSGYSLKRQKDKPRIAWHLVMESNLLKSSSARKNNLKENKTFIVITDPTASDKFEKSKYAVLKDYENLLKEEINKNFPNLPNKDSQRVYSRLSKDFIKMREKAFEYVRIHSQKKYSQKNGWVYVCPFTSCKAEYKRLKDLKIHYVAEHHYVHVVL